MPHRDETDNGEADRKKGRGRGRREDDSDGDDQPDRKKQKTQRAGKQAAKGVQSSSAPLDVDQIVQKVVSKLVAAPPGTAAGSTQLQPVAAAQATGAVISTQLLPTQVPQGASAQVTGTSASVPQQLLAMQLQQGAQSVPRLALVCSIRSCFRCSGLTQRYQH